MKNINFECTKLKKMSDTELIEYCKKIRESLIESIMLNNGHFSSSLGAIEIILAMHVVFDCSSDNFIFDIGHQADAHKYITNRENQIANYHNNDNSVFLDYKNIFDKYDSGHSSTSIAIATGMRIAEEHKNINNYSISLIGDGAFNGMAFASWNNLLLSTNNIVIINDNGMSISKNVGIYSNLLKENKQIISKIFNNNNFFKKSNFLEFENFILLTAVDGHDLIKLVKIFETAKKYSKPVIIHIKTIKGKGFELAEKDKDGSFHFYSENSIKKYESSNLDKQLIKLAKWNNEWLLFNPATILGSKIKNMFSEFPGRCYDVGINEEISLLFAAGSALKKTPAVVVAYSSFLQRGYDQLNHDINRLNLNVNIFVNKTGLHKIGATHHGLYLLNLCRNLNNFILLEAHSLELQYELMKWSLEYNGPTILRLIEKNEYQPIKNQKKYDIKIGKWYFDEFKENIKIIIISYGYLYNFSNKFAKNNPEIAVVNAIFLKPLDTMLLRRIINYKIIVLEEQFSNSGLGSFINEFYNSENILVNVNIVALENKLTSFSYGKSAYKTAKFDENSITQRLTKIIEKSD